MAYFSPIGNEPQTDANGDPIVGGQIFTYLAGTTTPATTYTAEDGLTPQANPIILNASGLPASPIWLEGGTAYKFVFQDANGVQTRPTVDNITGVNDPALTLTSDQWVTYTGTPTYLSATSFSLVGDQTNIFQANRRIKTTNTGGTIYSTIATNGFAAGVTTVTVINDSGTLDSGLSQVYYGLISAVDTSLPKIIPTNATAQSASGASVTFTGIPPGTRTITISFVGVSATSTDSFYVLLGDSGGVENTGYISVTSTWPNGVAPALSSYTAGFGIRSTAAGTVLHGTMVLTLMSGFTWVCSGTFANPFQPEQTVTAGSKTLSAMLDRIQIIPGVGTLDAGTINIQYA